MTIEEKFEKLNQINETLCSPQTTLEQSLELFTEGAKLSSELQSELDAIESKVQILVSENGDKLEFEDYNKN